MKNKASFFADLFMCILIIPCLFFCLTSSFDISVNYAIIGITSAVFCTVYALLAKLVQKPGILIMSVAVTMIVFVFTLLFSLDYVLSQMSYAVSQVLSKYSVYLPVAKSISFGTQTAGYATGFFVFATVIYSAVFTLSLIRFNKIFIIAGMSVLTLIPCFILVNTLPNIFCLIAVITILLTLYATKNIRRATPTQSGGTAAVASAVIAVMLAIILAFNPIEGYERFEWQNNALDTLQNITGYNSQKESTLAKKLESLDESLSDENLSRIAPISQSHEKVMSVLSRQSGNLYLKGIAYADYKDNNWQILNDSEAAKFPADFNAFCLTKRLENMQENITKTKIQTENPQRVIYSPYFVSEIPSSASLLGDVCLNNNNQLLSYEISHYKYLPFPYLDNPYSIAIDESSRTKYRDFVYDTYLQIPDSTRTELFKIAVKQNLAQLDTSEIPAAVKKFISESATYSLDTEQMPDGKDFPVWFLSECETGYCVHFATSATLMLRTLGVPARYVTGYYTNVSADEWETVTSDNAHAWVEFYDDNTGWIPLECTPSSFSPMDYNSNGETEPSSSAVEKTTEPAQTTVPATTKQAAATEAKPTTEQSNNPSGKNNASGDVQFGLISAVLCIALTAILLAVISLRRTIIINKRKKLFESGTNRIRVINIYRYLIRLEKYSDIVSPDEVTDICEKAKFSRHRISDEEAELVRKFAFKSSKRFYGNISFIKKLYYKYIIVLI